MGLIADIQSIQTTGPSALSKTKSLNPDGPILEIKGNLHLIEHYLTEAKRLATQIDGALDSGDGIKSSLSTLAGAL